MKRKAYAKINLNLIVKNKNETGMHELESVFHKIDLFDEIEIEENNFDKCILSCNIKELENDNLILKAYEELKERYDIKGLNVNLVKNIPMQAGLGGGSTDCATFIKMVDEYYKLNIKGDELKQICVNLGSDVLPCYYDEPIIVKGTGDDITPIISNMDFNLIVLKPELDCNTGLMYKKLDEIDNRRIINTTDLIIKSLEDNDIKSLVKSLFNSFEDVVDCESIKKDILDSGALCSLLTGSGSCVFGIYENEKLVSKAYEKLKKHYKCYMCKSIKK